MAQARTCGFRLDADRLNCRDLVWWIENLPTVRGYGSPKRTRRSGHQAASPGSSAVSGPNYDAFISYSHAKDRAIAAALQSAIQRLGKAWHQRRSLRVFRDDSSLSASPHLWPSIESALVRSRFLILLASPEAATSPWVNKEVSWWLDHRDADTLLVALTAGDLEWDDAVGDFRELAQIPVPPAMHRRLRDEPRWIDLRRYRDELKPGDRHFAELAAAFAAAIHGRPKEDLLSEEVRQQRRILRVAWSVSILLLMLLALAGWQWRSAVVQRTRAQRTLALATSTANDLMLHVAREIRFSGASAIASDIVDRVRKLEEQLSAGGENTPDLRYGKALALDEVAFAFSIQSDLPKALASARQAQAIFEELAANAPDRSEYLQGLCITDAQLSGGLLEEGNPEGAAAASRDCLDRAGSAARKDPKSKLWPLFVSVSKEQIGAILASQGDLSAALVAYRQSLAIAKEMAALGPTFQGRVAMLDSGIGLVLKKQDNLADALATYREGNAAVRALWQQDPNNSLYGSYSLLNQLGIADVLMRQGDVVGALARYRRVMEDARTRNTAEPSNALWKLPLWESEKKIGDALLAQGDLAAALDAERTSLALAKAEADAHGDAAWQHAASDSEEAIGDVKKAQGDHDAARSAYRESAAARLRLAQMEPQNVEAQVDLATSLYDLADEGEDVHPNLVAALSILKRLDAAQALPPYQRHRLSEVEAALDKITSD